jgi:hypothetical protein
MVKTAQEGTGTNEARAAILSESGGFLWIGEMSDESGRVAHDEEAHGAHIGCCGAYCRTCRAFLDGSCKGCKLGYADGSRDLAKAKCRMKVCCLGRGLETCADCPELHTCETMVGFFNKKGYKYRKYREAIEFIRAHGYPAFLSQADVWRGAYGRLVPPQS